MTVQFQFPKTLTTESSIYRILLARSNIVAQSQPVNVPPTAAFTFSANEFVVDFDASTSTDPDGVIVDWDWDFGDSTTGSGETVQHTYASPGSYTASLTVTDNNGAQDTTSLIVQASSSFVNTYSTEFNNSQYVNVPHSPGQNSVSAFSFFAWVKSTTLARNNDTIASKWSYATDGGWAMQVNFPVEQLNKYTVFIATSPGDNGGGCQFGTQNDVISASTWQHVGFTFAPGTGTIYVDGVPQPVFLAGSYPLTMQASNAPFRIGTWAGALVTRYWSGSIDEVTTWSKTLSAAEVAELYNNGTTFNVLSHSAAGDLISYYRMGDAPGDYATSNEIVDLVGGFSGTLVNGTIANRTTDVP